MESLSYTQEFYLCSINEKGKPGFSKSSEIAVCLLVGCLLELQDGGYLELEKKRYHATKPWDNATPYLQSVYEYVATSKRGKKIESFTNQFAEGKHANELMQAIGQSLAEAGCATEIPEQGLFGSKVRYAPNQACTDQVVEGIRAELLGAQPVEKKTVIVTAFLSKSNLLRDYFSKDEVKAMKDKLDQIKKDDTYKTVKQALDHLEAIIAVILLSAVR